MTLAPFFDLLRIDVSAKRLYLFTRPLPLSEMGMVYGGLIFGFLVLFWWALLYGRLFCGWVCPQTTLSELAATIDRLVVRRSRAPRVRKLLAAALNLLVALFFSWVLVNFFMPHGGWLHPGPVALTSLTILWLINGANLLLVRHRFCAGICPYGILQSLLADSKTLGVTMVPEPPDKCMRCGCCFNSCFMGIDVRSEPFSPLCLRCGDCVDAGNWSDAHKGMAKMVTFSYGRSASRFPRWLAVMGIRDLKRLAVTLIMLGGVAGLTAMTVLQQPLKVTVAADFTRVHVDPNGNSINHYVVTTTNHTDKTLFLNFKIDGMKTADLVGGDVVSLPPFAQRKWPLTVSAPWRSDRVGAISVRVVVNGAGLPAPVAVSTKFFVPDKKGN